MRGTRQPPGFVEKVRALAERGLSSSEAAAELSTPAKSYTRNSMIGISNRADPKFSFHGRPSGGRRKGPGRPRTVKKPHAWKSSMTISNGPTPRVIADRKTVAAPPRAVCSWHGCDRPSEDGDMFCSGHHRRGLM